MHVCLKIFSISLITWIILIEKRTDNQLYNMTDRLRDNEKNQTKRTTEFVLNYNKINSVGYFEKI